MKGHRWAGRDEVDGTKFGTKFGYENLICTFWSGVGGRWKERDEVTGVGHTIGQAGESRLNCGMVGEPQIGEEGSPRFTRR